MGRPAVASLSALVLAACHCGADRPPAPTSPAEEAALPAPEGCAEDVPALAGEVRQGVAYAHNYQHRGARGYGSEASRASRRELRALGVEWLAVTPFGFMRSVDDPTVRSAEGHAGAETDARMVAELEGARRDGFSIFLKPHLWIGGGAWRGDIAMGSAAGWERWLASYEAWILHYARMAAAHDVPLLAVGVELDAIVHRFPERWRALVARVREVYDGGLVYAANWDRATELPLWDAFDYVGVQFYPPLADEPDAEGDALDARMATYVEVLDRLHARTERPILFTEVGYRSVEGAAVRPHAWPERDDGAPPVDHAAQVRAYRAFFAGVADREWNAGVFVWKWFTDRDTDEEGPTGFSPRGKPAEAVLRAAYGGCDEVTPPRPPR
ncbi:MAG TPA: hypothetical protein RMH99_18615 [Sandaracinaceae bacterium LLY-WYZ-13_1]|nr:hypothetical protein [Sandaracinaceae bacterium LLY-WYZ-13_1]